MTWFDMQGDEAADLAIRWSAHMAHDDELVRHEYQAAVSDAFLSTGPAMIFGIKGDGYDAMMWTRYDETSFDILRVVPAPWLVGTPEPACLAFYAATMLSLERYPARRLRLFAGTRESRELARAFREHMSRHPIGDVVVSFDGTWLEVRQP